MKSSKPIGPKAKQGRDRQKATPNTTAVPAISPDDENPEWTDEDFARSKPAADVLPADVLAQFPKTSQERT